MITKIKLFVLYLILGLIMFKVPTNKRASNIGPYLNFIKFFIPTFLSVSKFGPCRQTVLTRLTEC